MCSEHLCPIVDGLRSEHKPPHTRCSINTNAKDLVWKKNRLRIVWLYLGADPSVAIAVITHTSLRKDSGVAQAWSRLRPCGHRSTPGPCFPHPLCPRLPARWPCVPSGIKGLGSLGSEGMNTASTLIKAAPPLVPPAPRPPPLPEGLSFRLMLLLPLLSWINKVPLRWTLKSHPSFTLRVCEK